MAGIYNIYEDTESFVILTTAANESIKDVHDRMPLIVDEVETNMWFSNQYFKTILNKTPCMLTRNMQNEQLKFDL